MRGAIQKSAMLLFCCAVMSAAASAQNFAAESLNSPAEGNPVVGPLVQGFNGHLYGISSYGSSGIANIGGSSNCGTTGCGAVFEVSPTGKLSALYLFCSLPSCADGQDPQAGLILGADGNFYGTTLQGGANGVVNGYGYSGGSVFKLSPSGKLTTIHSFCSQMNLYGVCLDGALPYGLVQSSDGNIYGTTSQGGTANQGLNCYAPDGAQYGCGTVFKITPTGKLTTIYNFCPELNGDGVCPDGEDPQATLVQGGDGNFYGTTFAGGANVCSGTGCGTIFEITPSGTLTTIYSFCPDQLPCTDGFEPGMLVRATNGNLYGLTLHGGPQGGGSVFEVTSSGKFNTLYGFCSVANGGPCPDGSSPASLMQATDGNFYGTTVEGGANCLTDGSYGCGTIFQMTSAGAITNLHSFCQTNCYDGTYPSATLAQGTNGAFYGLAAFEGADKSCTNGCGTIFQLSMGLGAFVEASPNFGTAGRVISILGNNLTGATSVTFNGTPATFTVVSSTLIKAHVPTGATTGTVQVITPNGTLSSNVPFQILP